MPKQISPPIVYVVDGDASVREGLSRLVVSAGLEARPCVSVHEFLREADGQRGGCVLLDVLGVRQCEAAVRTALHAVAQVLPVIALSASYESVARSLARELGAQSFFRQPVDAAALLDSIEWVLHGDAGVDAH